MNEDMLINFESPKDIRDSFDKVCKINRRTRTSVLVELMVQYVLKEGQNILNERSRADGINSEISTRRVMGFREWIAATEQTRVGEASDPLFQDQSRHPIGLEIDDHQEGWLETDQ